MENQDGECKMLFRMENVKDFVLKSKFILESLVNVYSSNIFMGLKFALKVFNFYYLNKGKNVHKVSPAKTELRVIKL